MRKNIINALTEAHAFLTDFIKDDTAISAIEEAAKLLINTFRSGNKVFSCGNGGSMCDAMHFAEELSGKFRDPRDGLPAIAMSDISHLTCVANDFGYQEGFSRYLNALGKPGDTLLAISTSGKSENIVNAAKYAKAHGINAIVLTGKTDSLLTAFADIEIVAPKGSYSDRTQEIHIKVIHILIELIERDLFPENY